MDQRLADANPVKDGKQTPWRAHPVFVAQHATATCCRGCLEKWHAIKKGRPLTEEEKEYIVGTIRRWLSQYETDQFELFESGGNISSTEKSTQ